MRNLLLAAILLAGCTTAPPTSRHHAPVINGTVDTGDPAVVALMEGGSFFCSGSLVAPRVVLTAGHCLEGGSATGLSIFFGTDSTDPAGGQEIAARSILVHPEYGYDHDIGLVELDAPAPMASLERNRTPLSEALAGQDVRVVGFGLSVDGGDEAGIKRTGLTTFDSLDGDTFMVRPKNQQSGCYGDSGGPNFMTLGGAEVIAGVTSFGTADSCLDGLGGNTDVAQYNDWVDDFVAALGPSGPTCDVGDGCLADCAVPDPDCPVDPPPGDDDGDGDDDDGAGPAPAGGGCRAGSDPPLALALVLFAAVAARRRSRRAV